MADSTRKLVESPSDIYNRHHAALVLQGILPWSASRSQRTRKVDLSVSTAALPAFPKSPVDFATAGSSVGAVVRSNPALIGVVRQQLTGAFKGKAPRDPCSESVVPSFQLE